MRKLACPDCGSKTIDENEFMEKGVGKCSSCGYEMEGYACPYCGARFLNATDLVSAADNGCDVCGEKFEVSESERDAAFAEDLRE